MRNAMYVIAVVTASFSCKEKSTKPTVNNDIESLLRTLTVPVTPVTSIWSSESLQMPSRFEGPEDFVVHAVLKFNAKDFEALRAKIDSVEEVETNIYLEKDFIKDWFPMSVRNKIHFDVELNRIIGESYSAKLFYKEPYLNGFCFLTDQNEIFICLSTQ